MHNEKSALRWGLMGLKLAKKHTVVVSTAKGQWVIMAASMASESVFDLKAYAGSRRALVESKLEEYLRGGEPPVLFESMRYSVLSPGKRMRALLCLAAAESVLSHEKVLPNVLPCACAIELVHAMSLIHDDLPSLDNDDFRRGQPTNHKVFGEAMALLAGDALLMLALEILLDKTPASVDRNVLLSVALELSRASGASGMVGGQVDDLMYTGVLDGGKGTISGLSGLNSAGILETIHRRKTGALIRFSLWSGARLAGCNENQVSCLSRFGEIIGLAFQIADDLLDVTGDFQSLGKTPGKDEAAKKATWVRAFGLEGVKVKLAQLESEGQALVNSVDIERNAKAALMALLKYAIHRPN